MQYFSQSVPATVAVKLWICLLVRFGLDSVVLYGDIDLECERDRLSFPVVLLGNDTLQMNELAI